MNNCKLFGNIALKCQADANRKLQIIEGKRGTFILIIEVVENISIKQGQIIEDSGLLFAPYQHLKGIIIYIFIAR